MAIMAVNLRLGSVELRPPWGIYDRFNNGAISEPQWEINATTNEINAVPGAAYGTGGGWPTDRLGEGKICTAHLDGNVEILKVEEMGAIPLLGPEAQLHIMSLWSPFAISDK